MTIRPLVAGVDFSGARDAGKHIWIAEGTPTPDGVRIDTLPRVDTLPTGGAAFEEAMTGLCDRLASLTDSIVGLDFPFSIPADLIEQTTWPAFVRDFADRYSTPQEFRDRLNERLRRQGPGVLHGELGAVDPDTAHRLNPADGQRIVRALEIFQHTGKPLSDWQSGQTDSAPEGLRFLKIVTAPPREELYSVIDDRFDWMIGAGAVEEVEALLDAGPAEDFPPLKAVGVPPIRAYIRGEIGRERMSELGKRDTRRYAKRQGTWFRHQIIPEITVQTKYSKKTNDQIFPEISDFLLTP